MPSPAVVEDEAGPAPTVFLSITPMRLYYLFPSARRDTSYSDGASCPERRGQRGVPFAPATGAARSGPALTPLRRQRPAGKRQDVVDVERPSSLEAQQAHQLPYPSPASGTASAAAFALICLWSFATTAAPAPMAAPLAPYGLLLTGFLPPTGDPPPGLYIEDLRTRACPRHGTVISVHG